MGACASCASSPMNPVPIMDGVIPVPFLDSVEDRSTKPSRTASVPGTLGDDWIKFDSAYQPFHGTGALPPATHPATMWLRFATPVSRHVAPVSRRVAKWVVGWGRGAPHLKACHATCLEGGRRRSQQLLGVSGREGGQPRSGCSSSFSGAYTDACTPRLQRVRA